MNRKHIYHKLKKVIRFLIALCCIIYLVRFFSQNKESLKLILGLDVLTIFLVFIAIVIYLFLNSYRIQTVLEKCSGKQLNFIYLFKLMILARFLNTVFTQTGNVYRAYRLKKDYDISYTRYISSFISILWMDTCFNLYFATIAILVLTPGFKIGFFTAWKIFLLIALSLSVLPLVGSFLLSKFTIKIKFFEWIHSKLTEVLSVTISNFRDAPFIMTFFSIGIVQLILSVLGYYILFKGFDIILSFSFLLVFYILLRLSLFIAITPGNIGVQEIVFGFISEQMGIGMASGILASAVARIITISIIFLMGLIFGGIHLLGEKKIYLNNQDVIFRETKKESEN